MRRVLLAAIAVLATAVPGHAIDPVCEITGQVTTELACGAELWDPVRAVDDAVYDAQWDEDRPRVAAGGFTIVCQAVDGTAHTGTTPVAESGSGYCLSRYVVTSTSYTTEYDGRPFTLQYQGTGSLDTGSGTFSLRHTRWDYRIDGTYTRIGATWSFTGTFEARYWEPEPFTGPFVGMGVGLPAVSWYPLEITAVA